MNMNTNPAVVDDGRALTRVYGLEREERRLRGQAALIDTSLAPDGDPLGRSAYEIAYTAKIDDAGMSIHRLNE